MIHEEKMHEVLEKHKLSEDYLGDVREIKLYMLGVYLLGKPDTGKWRDAFAENKSIPVPKNGYIHPHWALLDLYKLMATTPGIEKVILDEDMDLCDIPSLEETVEVLSQAKK